jgi:hypothetical protein
VWNLAVYLSMQLDDYGMGVQWVERERNYNKINQNLKG